MYPPMVARPAARPTRRAGYGYQDGRRQSAGDLFFNELGNETPEAANDYIGKTIESLTASRMPAFMGELQNVRENAVRRGITGGDLSTSYEGDLASAFQKNIVNETGSRAYDAYQSSRNRLTDMLAGQRDYETAQANAKRKRGGLFGKIIGTAAGAFLGPLGAAAGGALGDKLFGSKKAA